VSAAGQPAAGLRLAALREATVIIALGLGLLWLIPRQTTSGPVLGLPPAFLPTASTLAILLLAAVALAMRLARPEPLQPQRLAPCWPAALMLGIVCAGVLALQLAGPIACGLVIVATGLVALGERRVPVVLATVAGAGVVLAGVFQLLWR
jgi:hypothetical protein